MDNFLRKSIRKAEGTTTGFTRYLYSRINWTDRLIFIKGARGTGNRSGCLKNMPLADNIHSL